MLLLLVKKFTRLKKMPPLQAMFACIIACLFVVNRLLSMHEHLPENILTDVDR